MTGPADVAAGARQRHCLAAMGIDLWLPKAAAKPDGGAAIAAHQATQATQAGAAAADADDWERLRAEVAACGLCPLSATRTRTVFGEGRRDADWLFIGEGPGQHEDEQGQPFVGKAGTLLTEMIRALGMAREQVFITNIVKCRPPNNRDPLPEEIGCCNGYLRRQLALVRPKIIIAIGRVAAQTLLATDAPLAKLRGQVHHLNQTPLVVVYHPAYLLRSLTEKRKAWQDLLLALDTMGGMRHAGVD